MWENTKVENLNVAFAKAKDLEALNLTSQHVRFICAITVVTELSIYMTSKNI